MLNEISNGKDKYRKLGGYSAGKVSTTQVCTVICIQQTEQSKSQVHTCSHSAVKVWT